MFVGKTQLPFEEISKVLATYPAIYMEKTGCTSNGSNKYSYAYSPVSGYGGLTAEDVSCFEDFADSAAWYVTRPCDLLAGGVPESVTKNPEAGKVRYEYFKKEMFEGREYLPAGGCPRNEK